MASGLRRGEVRLCQFPEPDKQRAVVVLTQDAIIGHLATVTVAPISSAIRDIGSQVMLDENDGMKAPCAVNLHKLVTVRQSRLGARIAALNNTRMLEICRAIHFALGCR